MKINVKVKPNSNKNEINKITENDYIVRLTSPPHDGRANRLLLKLLKKYFSVTLSNIKIVSGQKNRNKVIEIKL